MTRWPVTGSGSGGKDGFQCLFPERSSRLPLSQQDNPSSSDLQHLPWLRNPIPREHCHFPSFRLPPIFHGQFRIQDKQRKSWIVQPRSHHQASFAVITSIFKRRHWEEGQPLAEGRWTDSKSFYCRFVLEPTPNPLPRDPRTAAQKSLPRSLGEVDAISFFSFGGDVWGTI